MASQDKYKINLYWELVNMDDKDFQEVADTAISIHQELANISDADFQKIKPIDKDTLLLAMTSIIASADEPDYLANKEQIKQRLIVTGMPVSADGIMASYLEIVEAYRQIILQEHTEELSLTNPTEGE